MRELPETGVEPAHGPPAHKEPALTLHDKSHESPGGGRNALVQIGERFDLAPQARHTLSPRGTTWAVRVARSTGQGAQFHQGLVQQGTPAGHGAPPTYGLNRTLPGVTRSLPHE